MRKSLTQTLCLALGLALPLWSLAAPLDDTQTAWVQKASRHEKGGWTYLHVEGAPRERGFQHGYLMAKEIEAALAHSSVTWHYQSAMDWSWLAHKAEKLFEGKIDAENLAEIDGIAEGLKAAGVATSRAELLAYNGIIELSGYWWPGEMKNVKDNPAPGGRESCSAFVATGSMTKDGRVVMGHNTMQGYSDVLPNVIIDIRPDTGHRILMQTVPGWIHSGTDFFITDAGLMGTETTIGGFESFDTNGVPEFVRMRRATQDADSIEAWRTIMEKGNNGGYANAWLLGDANSGLIARLEQGLKYSAFEQKTNGFFTGSNVAEDLKILRFETSASEVDIRVSPVARRERWKKLMAQHTRRIDLRLAKQFEADHYDMFLGKTRLGSRTLCGHFELEDKPYGGWPGAPFAPSGTVDGKVVDSAMAKRMAFCARWGSACGRKFDAPQFLRDHPQFDWMRGVLQSRPSQPWVEFHAGE